MNVSAILEVCIGLVLVYYILAVMVSAVTSGVTTVLQIRAKNLKGYLDDVFQDPEKVKKVMEHPLISMLRPVRLVPIIGLLTGETRVYNTEKIPTATFFQAFIGKAIESKEDFDELKSAIVAAIAALPENSSLKKDINALIEEAGQDYKQLSDSIKNLFDGVMKNASALFTAQARRIVIILALVVTLITGADSISLAQQLWEQPNLRAVAAAKAVEVAEGSELEPDIQVLISTLDELKLDFQNDWWNTRNSADNPYAIPLKVIGLIITWGAVSQGSSFWYDLIKKITSITRSPAPSKSPDSNESDK
jgi:hypothetical protein